MGQASPRRPVMGQVSLGPHRFLGKQETHNLCKYIAPGLSCGSRSRQLLNLALCKLYS
jgi:hypothetical protein